MCVGFFFLQNHFRACCLGLDSYCHLFWVQLQKAKRNRMWQLSSCGNNCLFLWPRQSGAEELWLLLRVWREAGSGSLRWQGNKKGIRLSTEKSKSKQGETAKLWDFRPRWEQVFPALCPEGAAATWSCQQGNEESASNPAKSWREAWEGSQRLWQKRGELESKNCASEESTAEMWVVYAFRCWVQPGWTLVMWLEN